MIAYKNTHTTTIQNTSWWIIHIHPIYIIVFPQVLRSDLPSPAAGRAAPQQANVIIGVGDRTRLQPAAGEKE